jgi:hypothetical protein
MNDEQLPKAEDIWDKEINKRISETFELIKKDEKFNIDDIDEKAITSRLIGEFNNLPENPSIKEGFLATTEEKIKIIILTEMEEKAKKKFMDIDEKIRKIGKEEKKTSEAA